MTLDKIPAFIRIYFSLLALYSTCIFKFYNITIFIIQLTTLYNTMTNKGK